MNIVFTSEQGFVGKVDKDFDNMRTEYAWFLMLDAFHLPYTEAFNPDSPYASVLETADLVIMIPSKKYPECLKLAFMLKDKKIDFAIMQEGPHNIWADWPAVYQVMYMAIIKKLAKVVLCHNKYDQKYFEGLTHQPVLVLPSVQDINKWKDEIIEVNQKSETVFVGGNLCRWYNGMISFDVANQPNMKHIIFPSMGRAQSDEEDIMKQLDQRVQYMPYMTWSDFMINLAKVKYAVHMMPEVAAGSFMLNCAMLGIPCIGNKLEDTQKFLFPELSVDVTDIKKAKELMMRLATDEIFYNSVRSLALERVKQLDIYFVRDNFKKQ